MTVRACRLAVLVLSLGLLAATAPAGGQEAPAAPAPAEGTPAPAETIPLPEVAERAEAVERLLRRTRDLLTPDPAVTAINQALPARREALSQRAGIASASLASDVTLARLAELEREWLRAGDQLGAWRRSLTQRATQLDERVVLLAARAELWARTRREAPDALQERMRNVEQEIRAVQREVETRRESLLTLQNQVAEEERRVAEIVAGIEKARAEIRSRLLEPDHPPAWNARAVIADSQPFVQVSEAFARELAALRGFARERRQGFALHALLFALVLGSALALRRRSGRRLRDDPDFQASAVIFERPFSTAALLALGLSPWLYPRSPRIAAQLLGLLLLPPVLRLLPRLLDPALRPAVYGLAALFVTDVVRDALDPAPLLQRAVLLLQTAVASLIVARLLRPARLAKLPADAVLPPGFGLALRAALALLLTSVTANLLGYTILAGVLADGVGGSAYAALLLYGLVRVTRAGARVALRSAPAQVLHMVRAHRPLLEQRVRRALNWAGLIAWVLMTLRALTVFDLAVRSATAALTTSMGFGTVEISLGDLIAFGITLTAAVLLARFLCFVLDEDVLPRLPLTHGAGFAVSATVRYALLSVGFLLALAAAGIDFSRFTLLAGALGVGIGFGLQNVVNNFVSGLILLYERPIQVGHTIQVGELVGEVRRIGIRSSTIRTWHGAEVIVPNGNLIADQVVNWTLSDRQRRMDLRVGVAYGTDPKRVLQILGEVARAHPEVLEEPPPRSLFLGFGDSSLDFELRAWTARFETFMATQSELAVAINEALREAGITIPFPQRDLHLQSVAPAVAQALESGGGEKPSR